MTILRRIPVAVGLTAGAAVAALWLWNGQYAAPGVPSGTWVPFLPPNAIDLRFLNEPTAGDRGFVHVKDGSFVVGNPPLPVRFWGVNVSPSRVPATELPACSRLLARLGVNLARIHGPVFDEDGVLDQGKVQQIIATVEALKVEGIYSHLSTYYWAWLMPPPSTPWLPGYDGKTRPVAALFLDPAFQEHYRDWWRALLLTPGAKTGRRLIDEPAVAGVEIQNEDSLLFWTFDPRSLPEPLRHRLEKRFGDWLLARHPSLEAALRSWQSAPITGDDLSLGRMAIRPIATIIRERTPRDVESVRFLVELQTSFYSETYQYLRGLGFRGIIGTSNWKTASPQLLDPLEMATYVVGDFTDRHSYVSSERTGPDSSWALRASQTYSDASALKVNPDERAAPRTFPHPSLVTHYDGKPTMLSEVSWERPSRHRSEAPLSLAVLGALQHEDAIVHFAVDGCRWSTSPRPEVQQPWTLASPAGLAQFPAAALIFRQGLVATGAHVAGFDLGIPALLELNEANPTPGRDLDPLVHLIGRVDVSFHDVPISVRSGMQVPPPSQQAGVVASTTGEVELDYRRGLLRIDAPRAQGASGDLRAGGSIETHDLSIVTDLEVGHVVALALDELPLESSGRILLQVMSEEMPSGFRASPSTGGNAKILSLGHDPWMIRAISGTVRLKRRDADQLRVIPLNGGDPDEPAGDARAISLRPSTTHYLIERK